MDGGTSGVTVVHKLMSGQLTLEWAVDQSKGSVKGPRRVHPRESLSRGIEREDDGGGSARRKASRGASFSRRHPPSKSPPPAAARPRSRGILGGLMRLLGCGAGNGKKVALDARSAALKRGGARGGGGGGGGSGRVTPIKGSPAKKPPREVTPARRASKAASRLSRPDAASGTPRGGTPRGGMTPTGINPGGGNGNDYDAKAGRGRDASTSAVDPGAGAPARGLGRASSRRSRGGGSNRERAPPPSLASTNANTVRTIQVRLVYFLVPFDPIRASNVVP
jgi:hypothetical protein